MCTMYTVQCTVYILVLATSTSYSKTPIWVSL